MDIGTQGAGSRLPVGAVSADQLFGATASSPQQLPSSGGAPAEQDMNSMLRGVMSGVGSDEITKALTPIAGGHSMEMPANLTRELPPASRTPQNHDEVVGAGNARARGIGNAITGTMDAIGSFIRAKGQQKQTADATKVHQLIESQQAIDQAQTVLKQDLNNADAKAILEHNTNVRNGLFEDKKFLKTVEKGFQISFTDPSANKTPEHAAVQQGIKLTKEQQAAEAKKNSSAYGEQFASKMPQQLAPNIMAQQRLQYATQLQQQYQKLVQAILPRMYSAKTTDQRVRFQEQMKNQRQLDNHVFQATQFATAFSQRKELAALNDKYKLGQIATSIKLGGQKMYELFKAEQMDPTKLFAEKTKFTQSAAADEDRMTGAIASAKKDYADIASKDAQKSTPATKQALEMAKGQLTAAQAMFDNYQLYKADWYKSMNNLELLSAGKEGVSGGTSGGSTTGIPPSGSSFDPGTLLNDTPFNFGGAGSAFVPSDDDSEDDNETTNPN
jgi:hypothetical protein